MNELRITPEEVLAAYKKTAMKVLRHSFFDGPSCGCPMSALAIANGAEIGSQRSGDVTDWAEARYGEGYAVGFVRGVDGNCVAAPIGDADRYRRGYTDGLAAWSAVTREG